MQAVEKAEVTCLTKPQKILSKDGNPTGQPYPQGTDIASCLRKCHRSLPTADPYSHLILPIFAAPDLVAGQRFSQWQTSFYTRLFVHNTTTLKYKYGITSWGSPSFDCFSFLRMLGKIGHACAVANYGLERVNYLLPRLILGNSDEVFDELRTFVGGQPNDIGAQAGTLHRLQVRSQVINGREHGVVDIRLFASLGAPAYRGW